MRRFAVMLFTLMALLAALFFLSHSGSVDASGQVLVPAIEDDYNVGTPIVQGVPVFFSDDFEAYGLGSLPAPWLHSGTTWQVFADSLDADNQVVSRSAGDGHYVTLRRGDFGWGDQALAMRFRWNGETAIYYWGSMGVRLNEDNGGYYLSLRGQYSNHLYLYLIDASGSCLGGSGGQNLCGFDLGEMEPDRWYTIMLRAKGNKLQVFVDGHQVGATITDHQNVAPTGRMGLGVNQSPTIVLDDVQLYDWTGVPAILDFSTNPAATGGNIHLLPNQNQAITFNWAVTDTQAVTLTANGMPQATGITGTITHTPTEDTVYTLTALGTTANISQSISVSFPPRAKVLDFSSSSAALISGEPLTLTWHVTNTTSVEIEGVGTFNDAIPTGTVTLFPTQTTSYILNAIGVGNTDTEERFVFVHDGSADARTLLHDDFESYDLASLPAPWQETSGGWQVFADPLDTDNQVASTSGATNGRSVSLQTGDLDWEDQAVSMRFRWNGDTSIYYWANLGVRLNEDKRGYYLGLRGQYTDHLYLYLTDSSFSCIAGPTSHDLCGFDVGQIEPDRWYTIMLRAKGNKLQVFFEGEQVGSTITDHQNIAPTGRIGLGSSHSPTILLDDVQVIDWTGIPVILDFASTPAATNHEAALVQGESINLTWDVVGSDDVSLSANGVTIASGITGTASHAPSEDTLYRLTAVGTAETVSETINATLYPAAQVNDFAASAEAVIAGSPVTLTWAVSDATSVEIEGIGAQSTPTGALTVFPTETTTYLLKAIGPANTERAEVTVRAAPISSIRITPEILPDGVPEVGNELQLGAQYVIETGDRFTVTEPITWDWAPADALTIAPDGQVSYPEPLIYQGTVEITATVGALTHRRFLYLAEGNNLFENASFESNRWWTNWRWSGDCNGDYTDAQARTGNMSLQLRCHSDGRMGTFSPQLTLPAGTYRLRGHLRGLNIAEVGEWDFNTDLLIDDGSYSWQPLLHGLFGWTPFEAIYHFEEETNFRAYIRLFAAGTLWMDDFSLVRVDDEEAVELRFGQAESPAPNTCQEEPLPTCPPAAPTPELSLTDFEGGTFSPFDDSNLTLSITDTAEGAQAAVQVDSSGWLIARDTDGLPTDWLGYDYLLFDIYNEQADFADFRVELWDDQSTNDDYWSQVNWIDKLAPGINHFRIPLDIYVGERIQLKQQRRLDLTNITRLGFSFLDEGSYRLSEIRLEEEPLKCSRPDWLHAFDFGTPTSLVMPNYLPIMGNTAYAACRGYGMQDADLWRAEDRRHPDALYRDWISFDSVGGDFALDLPDGEYEVQVSWVDAGYWEYYHHYEYRYVYAEGVEVCAQTETYEEYLDRYYQFESHEDLPDQDTWQTYIESRYQPSCVFTTTVTDGQLNLDFVGWDPHAASVNALVVYPTNRAAEAQTWLSQMDGLRKTAFDYDYRYLDLAGAQPDSAELQAAFPDADWLLFQRPQDEEIFANTVPAASESISDLALSLSRNERTPVSFALYPFIDLGEVVTLTVEGLPAGVTVDARQLFSQDRRLTSDGTVYASRPHLLKAVAGADLSVTRRFWLAISADESAADGVYNTTVRLELSSGDVITLPLTLNILPLTLPKSPIRHSVLGTMSLYPMVYQTEEKMWDELPQMLNILAKYGMTGVTGPYLAKWNGTTCDTTKAERYLNILAEHDFDPLINTYFSRGGPDLSSYYPNDAEGAAAAINCSQDIYASRGYTLTWSLYDEPSEAGDLQNSLNKVSWYSNLAGINAPGFLSSGYHSVHSHESDVYELQQDLFDAVDYPYLTLFSEEAAEARHEANKPWGIYNNSSRFGYSYYAWMLHKRYGLSDVTSFALQSVQSDPYYDLDSRESDFAYLFTTRSGDILPTVALEMLALGINDFRYLTALEEAIAAAEATDPATIAAQAFLSETLDAFRVASRDEEHPAYWFDTLRSQVIYHLLALTSPIPPAQVVSFSASPEIVNAQTPLTLSWEVAHANAIEIEVVGSGIIHQSSNLVGSMIVTPTQDTSYLLHAIGPINRHIIELPIQAEGFSGLHITPDILPDGAAADLQLGLEYLFETGESLPVTEPISWQWAPLNALTIGADGQVSYPEPLIYTGTVEITATVGNLSTRRFLYLSEGSNLLTHGSFESAGWWEDWQWEGECERGRSNSQAYEGEWSFRLRCTTDGRVAVYTPLMTLPAGSYRLRGHLRGFEIIESGLWGYNTNVMLYNQAQNEYTSQPLLHGSFGWTPFEAVYRLEEETNVRFYMQLYAPGTLWLDDFSLVRVHDDEPSRLHLGQSETLPPSACEEDIPLCISAPTPVLSLSDFANSSLEPFLASGFTTSFTDTTAGSQLELSGRGNLQALDNTGLPTDWQGYDYLTFDVYHEGEEIVDFRIELHDHLSINYWSRVNWYDKLAPGKNSFRIPLQIFVGERIQIQEPRRLDLSEITRLIFTFSETGNYRLSEVRLEEEPFKCSRPDWLHAFDFGTSLSPIMPAFHPITPQTSYATCRGYGLQNANVWRNEDRRHPDALYRDWISFQGVGGDFALDLPDGEYEVQVAWEDAGYWEYYQHYTDRRVYAEGVQKCQEGQTFSEFIDNYYQFESHEDLPNQDNWEIYISPRYQPSCTFTTTVSDGQLNLDFAGWDPYAATVNAVLVYPVTRSAEAETWLTQAEDVRRTTYNYDYRRLDLAGEQPDAAALPAGDWITFQRDSSEEIFANTVPAASEVITQITAIVAHNERLPATFALYPRTDLGEVTSLTVSGAPNGLTITPYAVTYLDRRVTADGTVYASRPHLLQSAAGIPLPANQARRFWLAISVDEALQSPASGSYTLEVSLQTSTGETITLPLLIEVLALTLPEQPIRHSVLGSMSLYPSDYWGQMKSKMLGELPSMLELLDEYGMNALTGPYLASWDGSNCDTTNAETYIAALNQYDFDTLINTYDARGAIDWSSYHQNNNSTDAAAALNCSLDVYASAGYTLTLSVYDEPSDASSLQSTLALISWYDALPNVNTPGFLSSGYHSVHASDSTIYNLQSELFSEATYPYITLFDESTAISRNGEPWGLYNHGTRFGYGFYAWMLHKKYGLTDVTAFALQSVHIDPYYTLDGREQDYAYIFTTKSGELRPTIALEQLSLGINDFRYLTALEHAIAAADPTDPATIAANDFLAETLDALTIDSRASGRAMSSSDFSPAWFATMRELVAEHVVTLQPPLAVELATFTAIQQDEQIIIEWQTVSEQSNLGFNLYRSTSTSLPELGGTEGGLIQLNQNLIPSQAPGSGQGSTYDWVDNSVQTGITYHYWVEDVDVNGGRRLHGPVSVTVGVPSAITIEQLGSHSSQWLGELLILMLLGLIMLGRSFLFGKLNIKALTTN